MACDPDSPTPRTPPPPPRTPPCDAPKSASIVQRARAVWRCSVCAFHSHWPDTPARGSQMEWSGGVDDENNIIYYYRHDDCGGDVVRPSSLFRTHTEPHPYRRVRVRVYTTVCDGHINISNHPLARAHVQPVNISPRTPYRAPAPASRRSIFVRAINTRSYCIVFYL